MAQAGSIKEISGSVSARTSTGQVRELNVGDLVYENELIETSDGSMVIIELDNGKTINLSENAQILIDESVIDVVDARDAVVSEVESLQAALEAGEEIGDEEATAVGEEDDGFDYDLPYYAGDQTRGEVGSYLFPTRYGSAEEVVPEEIGEIEEVVPVNDAIVSLTATGSFEGGTITYTATVDNEPLTNITVTLSNGEVVTILAGTTSGSVTIPAQADDVYVDPGPESATIESATGGGFDTLAIDPTPAGIYVEDTINPVTATLTSASDLSADGGTITYTVELNDGFPDISPKTDLTFELDNGESVTIKAGDTSGSVTVDVPSGVTEPITNSIDSVSDGGEEYEELLTAGETKTVFISDLTPKAGGGDVVVDEDDLYPDGSDQTGDNPVTGTFTIDAPDGVDSLTVGGNAVITAGVFTATSFTTTLGNTLNVTEYDSSTGMITYTYTLNDNEQHANADGENSLFDEDIIVTLTDVDGDSFSDTLTAGIVDDVPVAVSDTATQTAGEDTDIVYNVITNTDGTSDDEGADDATLTAASVYTGAGTVDFDPNGEITYDPADGEQGTVVIDYTITDGDGDTSDATLTINLGEDSEPTIGPESGQVEEADLPNDTTSGTFDISSADAVAAVRVDGVAITTDGVPNAFGGDYGELVVTYDGSDYNWVYTLSDNTLDHSLPGNDNVYDDFALEVEDSDGDTEGDTLTITVVDDVPIAVSDTADQASEDADIVYNVITNTDGTSDDEGADDATLTAASVYTGAGTVDFDPNGEITYDPADGEQGTVVIDYTITDGDGDTSDATLTINLGEDSEPTIGPESGQVEEADLPNDTTSGTFDISSADAVAAVRVDGVAITTDGVPNAFGGDYGELVVTYDGSDYNWVYTLSDNTLDHSLPGNDNVYDDFALEVEDSDGDTEGDTLTITVVDDVPVAYDPTDALLHNTVSALPVTESLNSIPAAIGADSYVSGTNVTFDSAQEGDSGLTSNDDAIYLYVSASGKALTGSTSDTEGGVLLGNTVFTVAITDTTDEYTVTMFGTIDNNSGASFSDLSGTGEAGNTSFKIVESSTTDNLEILFTPLGTATSVNSDSDDVGVGSQWINPGDGLRVDFGNFSNDDLGDTDKSNDTFAIDEKSTINGFHFSIDALVGVTPTIILSAYDDSLISPLDSNLTNDRDDPITKIEIYDDSGSTTPFAVWEDGDPDSTYFTDNLGGTGTVGVTGLYTDWSVVTYTADGYDGIEIMNDSGGKFSASNLKVEVTNVGDPVDQSFDTILTDADGDTSEGTIDVTFAPSDAILGTSGDDDIDFDATVSTIDGGEGYDTLLVDGNGALDFSNVDNVEKIDMNNDGTDQVITLSLDQVLSMTDENNVLHITGENDGGHVDSVILTGLGTDSTGEWTQGTDGFFTYDYADGTTPSIQVQIANLDDGVNINVDVDSGTDFAV